MVPCSFQYNLRKSQIPQNLKDFLLILLMENKGIFFDPEDSGEQSSWMIAVSGFSEGA